MVGEAFQAAGEELFGNITRNFVTAVLLAVFITEAGVGAGNSLLAILVTLALIPFVLAFIIVAGEGESSTLNEAFTRAVGQVLERFVVFHIGGTGSLAAVNDVLVSVILVALHNTLLGAGTIIVVLAGRHLGSA